MKNLKFLVLLAFSLNLLYGITFSQTPPEIEKKPFVLGEALTIKSEELGENRTLNIYMPEGYAKDTKKSYPVIYLLDGSADQDFIHMAGLVQFASFPWVKYLPKSILVGIGNTDRRRDFLYPTTIEQDKKDFPTNGGSAKFMSYIEKELQPFIDKNYRTNKEKTLIGQSFGGLLATEILFKKPELFGRYVLVSPSFWWDNGSLLKVKPMKVNKKTEVYVSVGNEDAVMVQGAKDLYALLEKRKPEGLKSHFQYFPEEDHGTILHTAVYNAFKKFYNKKVFGKAKQVYDHHVHLMSPRLIKYFKDVGIPFSRPDAAYSDIDTIIKKSKTNQMTLISMAYLFGHPEFGKLENEYETVKAENDYVLKAREKSPKNIKAFCGVNPLKDYALDEVKRCRKLKIDGIKIHSNANQLYLTEPAHLAKIKPIYKYAAENNLPILLHFDNSHPKFGEPDIKLFVDKILTDINPATFHIAHFGTSGGFNAKTKRVIDAFIKQFETNPNIKKHEIMFDISAVALDKNSEGVPKLTDEQFAELAVYARKIGFDKIVFGTDYPLYSAEEYLNILKTRVKLTDKEIEMILKN